MTLVETLDPTSAPESSDVPRSIDPGLTTSDRAFHGIARSIGLLVLLITGSIGVFLGLQMIPTLQRYGMHFFIEHQWNPERDLIGISSVLIGTIIVALVALVIAFPLALMTALFITEYSPARLRSTLIAAVDLMAAVPSIIYGLWGFFLLQSHAINLSRWISQHFSWIPIFRVSTDPNAASWQQSKYTNSMFIAGICVAMMVAPLATAVMRDVFAQAPLGEREGALALGSTKWGMIRSVVLPFGRGGIIGGTMLGLGRALGETVAVLLLLSQVFDIKFEILSAGGVTVASLIANRFGEATAAQLSALLAAGFVLFMMTLVVNTIAAVIVNRSRSGAGVDI